MGRVVEEFFDILAGGDARDPVIINEFLPKKATAKVGQKVTWTFDGAVHTVSF